MAINKYYNGPDDMPPVLALFPLKGVLLLPRGHLPLNIFEPRYLAMVDDAMREHRLVGIIQPETKAKGSRSGKGLMQVGCAGRITQLSETGDGRYMLTLTGISRFRLLQEMTVTTPYRQARIDFSPFKDDFEEIESDTGIDRAGIMRALRSFADANSLEIDWEGIDEAPDEALVNALAMMSPFGPKEKQALLEAESLKMRADVLIAITEMDLARTSGSGSVLQ